MASRPIITPYQVIVNQSMAGTVFSTPTIVQNCSLVSYDISWSGTSCAGILLVQGSNTYAQNAAGQQAVAGNWNTLPLSSTPTISQNSGNGGIDIDATGWYAIRLVYSPTAGTGTINATISGKVA